MTDLGFALKTHNANSQSKTLSSRRIRMKLKGKAVLITAGPVLWKDPYAAYLDG